MSSVIFVDSDGKTISIFCLKSVMDGTLGKVVGTSLSEGIRREMGSSLFVEYGIEVGIADGASEGFFSDNVLRTTVGKEVGKTEGSILFIIEEGDGKYEGFSFDCIFGLLVGTIVKGFNDGIVLRSNVGAGLGNND